MMNFLNLAHRDNFCSRLFFSSADDVREYIFSVSTAMLPLGSWPGDSARVSKDTRDLRMFW